MQESHTSYISQNKKGNLSFRVKDWGRGEGWGVGGGEEKRGVREEIDGFSSEDYQLI